MLPCFSFQLSSTARALWQNELLCLWRDVEVDILTNRRDCKTKSEVNERVLYTYSSTTTADLQC